MTSQENLEEDNVQDEQVESTPLASSIEQWVVDQQISMPAGTTITVGSSWTALPQTYVTSIVGTNLATPHGILQDITVTTGSATYTLETNRDDGDDIDLDIDPDDNNEEVDTPQHNYSQADKLFVRENPDLLYEFHETIKQQVEYIYPDNWDFRQATEDDLDCAPDAYVLTIKFPKVTVKNSQRAAHTIEDLYVRIQILGFSFAAGTIQGTRGKITSREYYSSYAHSHLHSVTGFHNFCLGGGTAFAHLISELGMYRWYKDKYDWSIKFDAFLFQLNDYVQWESLEGRPFRYIANIGVGSSTENFGVVDHRRAFKDFMDYANQNPYIREGIDYIINYKTAAVEVIFDDSMEYVFMNLFGSDPLKLCYRDHLGNFYNKDDAALTGPVPDYSSFEYKGETITCVFNDAEIPERDVRRKYINRNFINYFKNELERRFRKIWFEETFPIYARRINYFSKRRDAYNSAARLLEDYTVVQSSE